MPRQPAGPEPPAHSGDPWTRGDVEMWLKAAFRAMPFTSVFSPRGNTLQTAYGDSPDATFDILAFSGTVLGDKSRERLAVLFWARSIASGGEVGGSVAEFCDDMKWSRATFDRVRIRACEKIADAKNKVDCRIVAGDTKHY